MAKLRQVLIIAVACILVFSGLQFTLATDSDPTILYDEVKNQFSFINTEETDLFPGFKDVIPGDTLTQEIILIGENISVETEFFLKAEIHDGVDLPAEITLSVYSDGELISEGPADETSGLTEFVRLCSMDKPSTLELTAVLSVPTSIGNEISHVRKDIDWIFAVRRNGGDFDIPDTGDDSDIFFYANIMIFSVLILIILLVIEVNERRQKQVPK